MVTKGQRGESCSGDALLRLLHLDSGADALPGPSFSVSLSLVTQCGSSATRLQGRPHHTERL